MFPLPVSWRFLAFPLLRIQRNRTTFCACQTFRHVSEKRKHVISSCESWLMFFSLILYLTCCCVNPRDIIQYINSCFKSTLLDEKKKKKLHFLIASKIVWEFSETKFLNICPSTEYFFSQIFLYSSFISLMLPLFIEWVFLVRLTHKHRETILGKFADCSFSNGILHLIRWRVKWFYILFLSTFFLKLLFSTPHSLLMLLWCTVRTSVIKPDYYLKLRSFPRQLTHTVK